MKAGLKKVCIAVFLAAVAAAAVAVHLVLPPKRDFVIPQPLVCVIGIKEYDDSTKDLITGYNHYLLGEYALARNTQKHIRLAEADETPQRLISEGIADIVVVPMEDAGSIAEDVFRSCPMDSMTFWLTSSRKLAADISEWFGEYSRSEAHDLALERFTSTFNPFLRRSRRDFLSPYDDIIKQYSSMIDWDWRLLSALVYQESHFRINAVSRRGALGLMQMMPRTAHGLGFHDLLDPESSIYAGVTYLKRISRYFKDIPDQQERLKFILAAYNAGESRIRECIRFAKQKGLEGTTWEEIVGIIPEMEDFKGTETIKHVDGVLDTYAAFCRICP